MWIEYYRKLPADFDDLTSAQLRQLADHTDRRIEAERKAEQEARSHG